MTERRWAPVGACMTFFTGCALAAGMFIILLVTAKTGSWRILELQRCCVTLGAGCAGMRTNQFKYGLMLEC